VCEWCSDWYGENYYRNSPKDDPGGPETGEFRLLGGGSWREFPLECRSAYRLGFIPAIRIGDIGFRPVAVAVEP